MRIEPVHDVEHSATTRDLEHIVADSRVSGDLPEELSVLLDRILDFPEEDVEHAMISRPRVDVLRADETLDGVWEHMSAGHSRYPVLDDDDEIVGVVHLQDVLIAPQRDGVPVTSLTREAILVPTTMSLPDALQLLTSTRNQMACVLDEYGGFAGVLTLEDLAEELVGEITDEHDPDEQPTAAEHQPGSWVMAGEVHLDEVERAIDRDLPRGDYETLAGLAIATHGSLPPVGTVTRVELPVDLADLAEAEDPKPEFLRMEVLEVERHVPSRVRVTLEDTADDHADQAHADDHADQAHADDRTEQTMEELR
jgi:CBS domain containing-hemolysin-like protein